MVKREICRGAPGRASARIWPWRLAFGCLACLFAGGGAASAPNVVIVLADDMGLGDTSAYQDVAQNADGDQVATPRLEELAEAGVRFTEAYTTSSICSPSRYAILTGRYPWRRGHAGDAELTGGVVWPPQGDPLIRSGVPTLASMLRDHGYATAALGKWHLGLTYRDSSAQPLPRDLRPLQHWRRADLRQPLANSPLDHGFDFFFGHARSHHTSGAQGHENTPNQGVGPGFLRSQDGPHGHGVYAVAWTGPGKRLATSGHNAYLNDRIGARVYEEATGFLESHLAGANASRPFFLYYGLHSNHAPYTPDEVLDGVPVADRGVFVDTSDGGDREDFVHQTDVTVGLLMDFLRNTPDPRTPGQTLFDNTIFIFSSDNGSELTDDHPGLRRSVGPFRARKGSIYNGGFRVPLLISWPRGSVPAGQDSARLMGLIDLYASLAAAVGHDMADGEAIDSVDRMGLMDGREGQVPPRPVLLLNSVNPTPPKDSRGYVGNPRPSWLAGVWEGPRQDGGIGPTWKVLFDRRLMGAQTNVPRDVLASWPPAREAFNLDSDPAERVNQLDALGPAADTKRQDLIDTLLRQD